MMMGASSNVNGPIAETAHRYVAQKQLAISEDLYLHGSIDGAHKNINEMIGRYQNKQQMSLTDGRRAARYRRKRVYMDDRDKNTRKNQVPRVFDRRDRESKERARHRRLSTTKPSRD